MTNQTNDECFPLVTYLRHLKYSFFTFHQIQPITISSMPVYQKMSHGDLIWSEEISPTVWQYRGWYSQFFDSLGVEPLVHDGCLGDCVLDWHTRSLELNLIDIWKLPHKGCIGGGILDWHLWSGTLLLIDCNRGFFFDLKIVQSSSKFLSRHIKDVESLHCLFRVFIKETRSKVQIGPLKMCHQGRNSKM